MGEGSEGPASRICHAPTTSLYLRPDGAVLACCGGWQVLGWVTGPQRRSLREIWEGHLAHQLRAAVDVGDAGLGCWECGRAIADGRREASLAAAFDDLAPLADPEWPRYLDLALSNRCNLQCVMCNGGLSSAIRSQREGRPPLPSAYDDRFFEELASFLPHVRRASFKGGEPFLATENRRIWDEMARIGAGETCDTSVTTNGTIWNPQVERYLDELAMSPNVSIDALDPDLLRSIRVGIDAEALLRNLDRFQAAAERSARPYNLSYCLMATNWWELPGLLAEADRRGAFLNVIWVDGPARFGLLRADADELRRAADQLAADPRVPDLSERTRSQLDDAVARIRAAADHDPVAHASPVVLGSSSSGSSTPSPSIADLADDAGLEPVRLGYEAGVVRSVADQPWASRFDVSTWLGSGLEEFMTLMASAIGGAMRSDLHDGPDGSYDFTLRFEGGAFPGVRGIYLPDDDDQATVAFVPLEPSA